MEKNNKNIKDTIIGILVIIFYFVSTALTYSFTKLIGINYYSLNQVAKQIYLILCEVVITVIILYIYRKDTIPNFKDLKSNIKEYINKYIRYWFLMLGLMILSNAIITIFTTTKISNNQSDIVELLGSYPVYTLITTVLLAPIIEELIFRLSIRKIFKNDILFIAMSGLIFGSMHVLGNTNSMIDLLFIIPYSIPGFMFAYIYTKSKNICIPMGMHFMHNTIMIILQLIIGLI